MPTIEVLVNGRRHAVQCGQGEEARVRQLASYVDRRVTDLARCPVGPGLQLLGGEGVVEALHALQVLDRGEVRDVEARHLLGR